MQRVEHTFKAMGGPCRLRLELDDAFNAEDAIAAAVAEVQRLEHKYSRYIDDSLTSQINRAAGAGEPVSIDEETAGLLNYAHTAWQISDGLFDLTSGVLRRAWDFKSGRCPEQHQIDTVLPLVGWDLVQWDQDAVYLPHIGMELDFGGCVKEYAADCAALQLRRHGVAWRWWIWLATWLPSARSGNARLAGGHSPSREKDRAIAQVLLPEGGLASSGDYERCIEIDGVRYGHILHPRTGWPVSGPVAVSVLAAQCLVAGSSATIALLKPAEEALVWLANLGLPWLAIDAGLQCHGSLVK